MHGDVSGFAKVAQMKDSTTVAEWFETLAGAEKSHAGPVHSGLDCSLWVHCARANDLTE